MENIKNTQNLIPTLFKAVAVALGIAVVVLNTLGTATPQTNGLLLGLGVALLGIVSLRF